MESSHKQICRTCLVEAKENQTLHFIYDFATENSNQSVSDLLLSTIPNLHIEFKDVLPKNICKQCLDTLVKLADFQRMCLQSEHQLFQLLGNGPQTHSTNTDTASTTEIVPQPDPLEFEIKMLEDINLFQNNDCLVKEEIVDEIIGDKSSIGLADEDVNGERETIKELYVVFEATPFQLNNDKEITASNAPNQILFKEDTDAPSTSLDHYKYVCEYCDKGYSKPCRYEEHLRTHTGERPFKCTHCDKNYTRRQALQEHLKSHTISYKCPHCPESFARRHELYSHKKVHEKKVQEKRHTCADCGVSFHKRFQLTLHKVYHQGEKKYECKYCRKSFFRADHVRRHQNIHTGVKPYKCKYCDCNFRYHNQFTTHLRTHIGENIYRCKLCPQRFRLAIELREHMATAIHKSNDVDTTQSHDRSVKEQLDDVINSEKVVMDKLEEATEAKEGNTDTAAAVVEENERKASGSIEDLSEDKINDNKQVHVPTGTSPLSYAHNVNYACDDCGASFRKRYQLTPHMKYHQGQRKHKCKYCDKSFCKGGDLRRHQLIHTDEKPYKCKYCDCTFKYTYQLNTHLRTHIGENIYRCKLCPQKFRLFKELREHMATAIHKSNDVDTTHCQDHAVKEKLDDVIASEKVVMDKMEEPTEAKEGNTDTAAAVVEENERKASGTIEDLSEDKINDNKQVHVPTGTSPLSYAHNVSNEEIDKETKSKRQTLKKDRVCKYCDRVFKRPFELTIHLRRHTGEKPYLCSECGKGFTNTHTLQQHFLLHGEKRYECTECPAKFYSSSNMQKHRRKHFKIKTNVCDTCGSSFITPYELTKHKLYHTGVKPHKCSYCEKSFVVLDGLRRHERTHTGEKPYKCQYCIMAYAQRGDLMKHLRKHLGENIYRCELCPQRFRLLREVREHFPSHKNEDEATRLKNLQAMQEEDAKLKAILTMPENK